jgi:hypothetical protein
MRARISKTEHVITIGGIGSEAATLTAWRDVCGIGVNRGCFTGTLDEFEARVKWTHGDNEHAQEYAVAIALIRKRAERWEPLTEEEKADA